MMPKDDHHREDATRSTSVAVPADRPDPPAWGALAAIAVVIALFLTALARIISMGS